MFKNTLWAKNVEKFSQTQMCPKPKKGAQKNSLRRNNPLSTKSLCSSQKGSFPPSIKEEVQKVKCFELKIVSGLIRKIP